jgi:HK97 family phage major capsid protein
MLFMDELKTKRAALLADADKITDAAIAEKRALTADEKTQHDALLTEARGIRDLMDIRAERDAEAVKDLDVLHRAIDATEKPAATPKQGETRGIYNPRGEHSFFVDTVRSRIEGDEDARQRLSQEKAYISTEMAKRDLHNGANAGGEAVVPLYLQDKFEKARVNQAVASGLTSHEGMPPQGESITIPVQTGSASVAALTQASPLNALSETDATFDVCTESIVEIGGVQDLSNFIVDRGTLGVGVDVIIANHLSELLAQDEDQRVLAKVLSGAGVSVTATATTGTLVALYAKIADAIQQINTANKVAPTAIVVHPRRFGAWMKELDDNNRPLMVPMAVAQNPFAVSDGAGGAIASGFSGYSIHGLPIFVDANVPTTGGAGTNEDAIYICDWKKQYTWLGPVMVDLDRSLMFKNSGMTVRARRYFATMVGHRDDAFGKITGTALATPSFA